MRVASTSVRTFRAGMRGRRAGRGGRVLESSHAQPQEPVTPSLHRGPRDPQRPRKVLTQHPVSGERDEPGTVHDSHGQALRLSPRGQRRTLLGGQHDRRGQMHTTTYPGPRNLLSSYL